MALKDPDRFTNAASLSQSLNPHRERLAAHGGGGDDVGGGLADMR